jgi:hypothetical protein
MAGGIADMLGAPLVMRMRLGHLIADVSTD